MDVRASVARGSTDDGELLPLLALLLGRVPALKEVLKQVAEELERDVLERKRRSVEELEHVLLFADLVQRRRLGVSEGSVRALDEVAQVLRGDLRRGYKERDKLEGKLGEGQTAPFGLPVGREGGDRRGDVEPAVGGESGQDGLSRVWVQQLAQRQANERDGPPRTRVARSLLGWTGRIPF